eukprot:CAMPEP_0167788618 /NCGR_PEP_ID=MMETSP0111_2-20121227/10148_1 /TAXON_ID=91324 /ORGANISM="Lotharella globosa, Strain CCCM811" /LENGTH=191 /DNA_ID=CAMNT_0007680531 /DNA_START=335 /DNA_END=910 /DNA_ORIENTATION=+
MANEPITVVLLLAKLDCGHVVQREVHVEGEEHAQGDEEEHADQVDNEHDEIFKQERGRVHDRTEGVDQAACHSSKNKAQAGNCIEKQEEEKLVVAMSNTVRNPWAMVVHSQNASVANSAMVGPIRFVKIASRTMPIVAVLLFPFQDDYRFQPGDYIFICEVGIRVLDDLFNLIIITIGDLKVPINPSLPVL